MYHLALDIETLAKPVPENVLHGWEVDVLRSIEQIREELSSKYKKAETIEAHMQEEVDKDAAKLRKMIDKWGFERQGAQILCVGVGLFDEDGAFIADSCTADDDEYSAIKCFIAGLDSIIKRHCLDQPTTVIYTYNGDNFDIPHLTRALIEHHQYPSMKIKSRGGIIDLMKEPYERFCGMNKLDDLYALYKLPNVPEHLLNPDFPLSTGADVARMWEADKVDMGFRVRNHCLQDVYKVGVLASHLNRIFRSGW